VRLNKFIALSSDLSRRGADTAISEGRVTINGITAAQGQDVSDTDAIRLDGNQLAPRSDTLTVLLHKPRGYVVSRNGQGSKTIYDLLPKQYQQLNSIGRLDKDSSGLLLLTNDGQLAQSLTHPSRQKLKVYQVMLNKPLEPLHHQMIHDHGIVLEDGISKLRLEKIGESTTNWLVTMHEGRKRQIRRTFSALGYTVVSLHRLSFGDYTLGDLNPGEIREVN
jgi:23S rRNA pseudouridine2605 synthase